jgi:hypothetical protein
MSRDRCALLRRDMALTSLGALITALVAAVYQIAHSRELLSMDGEEVRITKR